MCGITGFWSPRREATVSQAAAMAERIKYRGPDDTGTWLDARAGLAFAHRRLSILDLSPAGHQPMRSPCGRYVLCFNGEIYNHRELRNMLDAQGGGFEWRGHSDTETLLAALRHWGVTGALPRLNGMFAFALWDASARALHLARDRMGEKPLYYGRSGESFLFGSELKAMTAHADWRGEIDRDVLSLYMRYAYVPAPWSIYRGICKLPAAHHVTIRDGGTQIGEPVCYWSLSDVAERGASHAQERDEEYIDELNSLLRDAVGLRMEADVPLGAFLSGGYDSTAVVAMMQAQSPRRVKTFSIGFHETGYDEAPHAKAVAAHLGTEHTELYVTADQALAVVPKLPSMYDEPFADSSQIPTYLVSTLARQHVTVALSGDGGDELFGGYNRYTLGHRIWSKLRPLPYPARKVIAWLCIHAPGDDLDRLQRWLPNRMQVPSMARRLPILAEALAHRDGLAYYRQLVSHWKDPAQLVRTAEEPATLFNDVSHLPKLAGLREQMMYLDMVTYLCDDILTKVDRASMAVSLEARVPLLDHRLVEFAWRVPTELKIRQGTGKWLLRQLVHRYVPQALMVRPKMGFGIPIDHWLRGPLRDWAISLLEPKSLGSDGFFDVAAIRASWSRHVEGRANEDNRLWAVLMFQAWKERNS